MKKGRARGNGEGTVFQLPSGKWKAQITIFKDGKRSRPSRICDRKSDAYAKLSELKTEAVAPACPAVVKSVLLMKDYLSMWLKDVVSTKSPSTIDLYGSTVKNHVNPYIGDKPLHELRPLDMQTWIADLQRSGVGSRTVEVAYTTLRNAMNHAADRLELIPKSPLKKISKPSHEREEIFPLNLEESRRVIRLTEGTRYHALMRLAISTGMRQGELFGLRWDRVDFKNNTVTIDQQVTEIRGALRVGVKLKTRCSRRVLQITEETCQAIRVQRAILMTEGNASSELVFPSPEGGAMSRGNFRVRVWKPLLSEAEIAFRGFHHVRHTYATLALGELTPIAVVSKTLGHSKVSITHDIYSHVLPEHTQAATATMARLLG